MLERKNKKIVYQLHNKYTLVSHIKNSFVISFNVMPSSVVPVGFTWQEQRAVSGDSLSLTAVKWFQECEMYCSVLFNGRSSGRLNKKGKQW